MPEVVTVEVSEDVARRARETAQRTGRQIEAVLAEWLERGAASEDVSPIQAAVAYGVHTPYGNEAAARVLLDVLRAADRASTGTDPNH